MLPVEIGYQSSMQLMVTELQMMLGRVSTCKQLGHAGNWHLRVV